MSHACRAFPAAHCHDSSDLTIPMPFYFHWHGCFAAGRSIHMARRWAPGSRGHSDSDEALGISSGYKQRYAIRLADTREPSEAVPCEPCKIVRGGVWGYIIPTPSSSPLRDQYLVEISFMGRDSLETKSDATCFRLSFPPLPPSLFLSPALFVSVCLLADR